MRQSAGYSPLGRGVVFAVVPVFTALVDDCEGDLGGRGLSLLPEIIADETAQLSAFKDDILDLGCFGVVAVTEST